MYLTADQRASVPAVVNNLANISQSRKRFSVKKTRLIKRRKEDSIPVNKAYPQAKDNIKRSISKLLKNSGISL